jgi:hypothetical protein
VVVAWVGGLMAAVAIEEDFSLYGGIALTVLAGVLIDRWWAVAVPIPVTAAFFAVRVAIDPDCSECGEDPYELQLLYTVVLFTLPAAALMALGVGARRSARSARRRSPPRERHAP